MRYYLSKEDILTIHSDLISNFGGDEGIRDIRAIESALGRLQSGYYNDIIEEAAALMESLAINHPFVDGNKRSAFFASDVFLRLNGHYIDCDNKKTDLLFRTLLETEKFNFSELSKWLKNHTKRL